MLFSLVAVFLVFFEVFAFVVGIICVVLSFPVVDLFIHFHADDNLKCEKPPSRRKLNHFPRLLGKTVFTNGFPIHKLQI